MNPKQPDSFSPADVNRKIFLYKPDKKTKATIKSYQVSAGTDPEGSESLQQRFPDLLITDDFIKRALSEVSPCRQFATLVVQIDPLPTSQQDSSQSSGLPLPIALQISVAETIAQICARKKGIWGRLRPGGFGSFLPDLSDDKCLILAREIQTNLSQRRSETVSIGVAAYPCINFSKSQIIVNAEKALEHARFFGPNSVVIFDAVSLNISADKLYQQRHRQRAVEEFKLALKLDPTNVNVHNSLGVCYGELGELEKALEEFETALWLDPKEVMAVYNKGLIHALRDDKATALQYFLEANREDENIFEVLLQTGRLYLDMQKWDDAGRFLEKAARLEPEAATAQAALGEYYHKVDQSDAAVAAFQKAVKSSPNDAASLSALGELLAAKGENLEIATTFCQHSIALQPQNPLFHHRLGKVYLTQNRLEDALKAFNTAQHLGHAANHLIDEVKKRLAEETNGTKNAQGDNGNQ